MSHFGACILGLEGLRLTADEKTLFQEVNPFGFILFARNIDTPEQVRDLCSELRASVTHDPVITIDQEGGRVQRLRTPHWHEWTPPLDFVTAAGTDAGEAIELRYRLIAHELFALGIDSNCAPMVDIAGPNTHPFLRNRCYSSVVHEVSDLGLAAAKGLLDGGVLPIVKHIPGHGRAEADSHFDLPTVNAALGDLLSTDFAPFKALNQMPMGMTAHIVYDAIDPAPATLSRHVMEMIRRDIGFDGLIMTDDISMKALSGTLSDLSRASIAAGCDVVLHCNGSIDESRRVAEAVGEMSGAAQSRAQSALGMRTPPKDIDIDAAFARLDAITN